MDASPSIENYHIPKVISHIKKKIYKNNLILRERERERGKEAETRREKIRLKRQLFD